MFSRGNRFPAVKPPEVPGPNAYNVKDPEYDAYKRGAFLEKQDRFNDDEPSDVPGPGTYVTDDKTMGTKPAVSRTMNDRQAVLQRKVEELERLLAENKKASQAEVERIKTELGLVQRTNAEQTEQIGKLKKQNEIYDVRLKGLRHVSLSDQSEIKELRAKLRVSEHERSQLASKQGNAGDAKKALQALELRRRSENQEKDKQIEELEKAFATEKRRNGSLEAQLGDAKDEVDAELVEARFARQALEAELQQIRAESDRTRSSLASLRSQASSNEDELLQQLEDHRRTLSRVAQEYGRLASSTVPKTVHDRVKRDATALQLRVNRLERKFANAEGQVVELAQLIRHTMEQNDFLSHQLKEVEEELSFYTDELAFAFSERDDVNDDRGAECLSRGIAKDFYDSELLLRITLGDDREVWAHFDRLRTDELFLHSVFLLKHLDGARHDAETNLKQAAAAEKQQSELVRQLSAARAEHGNLQLELADTTRSIEQSRAGEQSLKRKHEAELQKARSERTALEQAMRREKDACERLTTTLQQSKAAEDALSAEVDQLSRELAEAEKYEQAYNGLVDEVDALVRRNALAEDEAQRLSRFNAEILGHHNPAQRIQYVDRIRSELHDTKQDLLMMTKDRDAFAAENDDLIRELQLYKSVAVPADFKPRSTLTRVARKPLTTQSLNARSSGKGSRLEATPEHDYKAGDMTLDEIL
ncbi:uncharacterized protein PHACADRAFT_210395 [Phanerochaete carnosa HHB-10118-sp]|uniref:Hyaluronan-mediated motility receptor C-terminal domain-containing protein n=1 Tax=Phanerochaete carnosa (strain HHB-10118-sp) TaxID=650164 RepID=K5UWZ0_PHACS|nr:uncharacterized protein PHACADRAFT_210395 [Phanerochaete carnosa HHB-10118-sp]EKM54596.1 hypothetical protein PHACADRAFT_210395 [Phanerochaete carnosa HHB-10118-sp]